MHYFFWGCLRESRFRELLLSSISCTLSSRGCLVGRASFARCFLPLLSALASERASFSPLVSCSLLVEQIRESKRPELVLQNSLGTPQEWQGSLFICPSPHPEGAGIVKEVIFSSLICTTNWTQISFFFHEKCFKFCSALSFTLPTTKLLQKSWMFHSLTQMYSKNFNSLFLSFWILNTPQHAQASLKT